MSDKRPDKYDVRVADLYPDLNPRTAKAIADFGRDAAAEAYEDAANMTNNCCLSADYRSKAAALRAGKGE